MTTQNWQEPATLGTANLTVQQSEAAGSPSTAAGQVHRQSAQRAVDAERARRQHNTARYAQWLWTNATPADPSHPYLLRKQVPPYGLRQKDQQLLVPLISEGRLLNLQCIAPDGDKRFLKGGRVQGCHALLGTLGAGARLYLCEGWATGATLHAATGCPVACAMNAGNLLAAGRQLWQEYPDCELVVAGDDHGCVSSSMPHQSDQAFQAWRMPTVSPGTVAEYVEFGLYGWELSRFSGNWVGFTALSEVVESGSTVDLDASARCVDAWKSREDMDYKDLRKAGSLFLAIDSIAGPMYFAYGKTVNGNSAFYLFYGRPTDRITGN